MCNGIHKKEKLLILYVDRTCDSASPEKAAQALSSCLSNTMYILNGDFGA